ncbi:MAG: PQQ-binding-like beta-propeller repeat protein [Planctomycetaceae bacterium]|nr:PQQ-binding-like beta-propeller repeat protein [Planctomycetaceae bacterium]
MPTRTWAWHTVESAGITTDIQPAFTLDPAPAVAEEPFAMLALLPRFALIAFVMLAPAWVGAQEWTRYRGPNGTGLSDAKGIPTKWTEADYNWKTKLPGIGHSSPVLWGKKIFLTSANEETATRYVMCLDADSGKIVWQREFPSKHHHKHLRNSFASPTGAVDESQLYISWSEPDEYTLMALDHDGKDRWKLNLGPYVSQHSAGPSPIVYDDMVILCNEQDGPMKGESDKVGVSFLLAVDRKDGKLRWRTDRVSAVVTYSTPCVYQPPGQKPVLLFNSQGQGVTGVDPLTGQKVWEVPDVLTKRSVSSPVFWKDLVFATCGSGGGGGYVAAVRTGAKPEIAYKIADAAPYVPSLLVKGDRLYMWSDKGIVSCVNPADGTVIWKERIGNNFSGSPICIGDNMYGIAEDGEVFVIAAKDKYELVAKLPLGEDSRSTPSVADGKLYLRTYSHLISLGGKK